jgi:hypothetical protein
MNLDVERLPLRGQGGLFDLLCEIPEPRKRRGIRHPVRAVLGLAICAVLAGARNFAAIAEWAADQSTQTLKLFGSKWGRPPSERTFRRVLDLFDPDELDRRLGGWMTQQQKLLAGAGLALDGKTVRGSADGDQRAVHLLSAVVHGSGTVVAQTAVDSKTNEITRVAPLLENLEMKGTVVTGDALLTQREIARHIVEDKDADFVFTVKDNQPTLRWDIEDLFDAQLRQAQQAQQHRKGPPKTEAFPPSTRDV